MESIYITPVSETLVPYKKGVPLIKGHLPSTNKYSKKLPPFCCLGK